jgi:GAF domain-containing protein
MDYKQTLDIHYTPGKNKLADSLIQMQQKLKAMNEAEARRQWANEGITKFVEIMRSSNDNLESLGDSVISALVQYTNSNQGALYILNDEDQANKYLELISLFAFDIKKYQQQKIKLGEGILGQTFLEKETTHLTNMPEEYIRITSGLGDANPRALLLFPLKVDKEAYGIIELASFQEYKPHEIEFVEKLGESIAATLASVKAAQKNRQLIEQFQQQTEEMRAQEEEMRQNMEELQATQEEVARKEQAYLNRIKELESKINDGDSGELEIVREKANRTERELRLKVEELTAQLAKSSTHADDWDVAQEVEKTLKMNLEAIKITQEELNRKAGR